MEYIIDDLPTYLPTLSTFQTLRVNNVDDLPTYLPTFLPTFLPYLPSYLSNKNSNTLYDQPTQREAGHELLYWSGMSIWMRSRRVGLLSQSSWITKSYIICYWLSGIMQLSKVPSPIQRWVGTWILSNTSCKWKQAGMSHGWKGWRWRQCSLILN